MEAIDVAFNVKKVQRETNGIAVECSIRRAFQIATSNVDSNEKTSRAHDIDSYLVTGQCAIRTA
jgi:hypothetical protein